MTHAGPETFRDVGTLDAYLDANLGWLADRGEAAWVAPSARVAEGIALDRVVVGAGANVVGAGRLERVVEWPGATARAPLADAVVTSSGSVVPLA